MRALLVPLDGGKTIELEKDLTLIGRKEDCDLRLEHKSVSKLHCVIVKTDGLLLLRDLGSTNSTRVNGQRVRRAALLPNDQLTIANYRFKILLSWRATTTGADFFQISIPKTTAIASLGAKASVPYVGSRISGRPAVSAEPGACASTA